MTNDKRGKCLECNAPIDPARIGYCDKCFAAWLETQEAVKKER